MPGTTIPPVFFVSYARADTDDEPYRKDMQRFIGDLSAKVAVKMGVPRIGICFFDESSIETGTIWRNELADALKTTRVGMTLYSPSYFTSLWCGKEFQVFLNRAAPNPAVAKTQVGIVPVLWMKRTTLPPSVQEIQYKHDAFPREYMEVGVQQLLSLKVYSDHYQLTLEAIADGIVSTAAIGLAPVRRRTNNVHPLSQRGLHQPSQLQNQVPLTMRHRATYADSKQVAALAKRP